MEGQRNDENMVKTSITIPHICTYYRGQRYVFAASKRQGTVSSQAMKGVNEGKKKIERNDQQENLRRSKRLKKTTQGPEFIDLDSDEQDEEMTTKMLLLEKYAQSKNGRKILKEHNVSFSTIKMNTSTSRKSREALSSKRR